MKSCCTNADYFYFPKELLFDNSYSDFDVSSKILFSILLSYAESGTAIVELGELIVALGSQKVDAILSQAQVAASDDAQAERKRG